MTIFRIILIAFLLQYSITDCFSATGKPKGGKRYLKIKSPDDLKAMFRYTGDSVCFLSSHRGGPENHLCENSIAAFENTLLHTYSMMEIDPHWTRDSILVVMHDPTLQRTSTGEGRIADYTLKELRALRLKNVNGNVTDHKIHTLKKVLKWARGRTIIVMDKKEVSIQERVRAVEKSRAEAYTIIMAYTFDEAKICYGMNRNIMMQIFIPNHEKLKEFDQTGVPWSNVVAFVSHQMPADTTIFDMIHRKGALCILGTSRNLDLEATSGRVKDIRQLEKDYNDFYRKGADILETDIPVEVSKVVARRLSSPTYRAKFLK
jgi:glycerophosphoryl diester phosphodiesterase